MQAAPMPSASGAPRASGPASAAPAPAAPVATEIVRRPDAGIARGKWEAAPWVFWVALAAVVVASTLYFLRRAGVLKLGNKKV